MVVGPLDYRKVTNLRTLMKGEMVTERNKVVSGENLAARVLKETDRLRKKVNRLRFDAPVTHVYNPLDYAWGLHSQYVEKWGSTKRRVLLLGMNPGPWGMAQTGVPFGEVAMVRDFLRIEGSVSKPKNEHPKRPVLGLKTKRSEVSGSRLWGFFDEACGGAEGFFADHFVVNYCPLVFMEESARNRTPDKLPVAETAPLFAACDQRLIALVNIYQPEWVVGVGGFARKKLDALFGPKVALIKGHRPGNIGTVLHPSPASPAANRGWAEAARRQLLEQGIWTDGD